MIAGATANAGYDDWSILYKDDEVFGTRFFEGEPLIDQQRLLADGVLSVFIQEGNSSISGVTTSDLHVFDFAITNSVPEPSIAMLLMLGGAAFCLLRRRG